MPYDVDHFAVCGMHFPIEQRVDREDARQAVADHLRRRASKDMKSEYSIKV